MMSVTTNHQSLTRYLITSNTARGRTKFPVVYETAPPLVDVAFDEEPMTSVKPAWSFANSFGRLTEANTFIMPSRDTNTTAFSFMALLQEGDTQLFVPANNLVQKLVTLSHDLLANALKKCRELLDEMDVSEEISRDAARARIKDVLEVFSGLSGELIREIVATYEDRPDIVGFVLSECFVEIDSVVSEVKVDVISRLTMNSRASIRYEAVRALDAVNDAAAMHALQWLRSSEPSRDVQRLIDESLRSYAST